MDVIEVQGKNLKISYVNFKSGHFKPKKWNYS